MLVSLKTLQEDIFTVEIDPSNTVKNFKEAIEKAKGEKFPAKNMKLMYAGKFLVDNNRVSDYNVEEKKFVIVVVKKPKAPIVKDEDHESSPDTSIDRNSFMRNDVAEENRLGASEQEALVRHIIELGFARQQVETALRASYNNPDRAVEYLLNGIFPNASENEINEPEAQRRRNPDDIVVSSDPQTLRQTSEPSSSPANSNRPNQERLLETFNETFTDLLNQRRAAIRTINEISDFVRQNPGAIPDDDEEDDMIASNNASSSEPSSVPMLVDGDFEVIGRLKQLGFSTQKAIEAYFVCDRNENAAADYLFSENFD